MNKNILRVIVLSMIMLVLFSGVVAAKTFFPKAIEDKLSALFSEVSFDDSGNYKGSIMYLKVLLFIIIFGLLYGASEFVLKDFAKGARTAVTVAIALIASIGMPNSLLLFFVKTYMSAFIFLLVGVPVIGGLFLVFRVFNEKEKHHYFAKGAIFLFISYILTGFSTGKLGKFGTGMGEGWGTIVDSFAFVSFVFLFMGLWNILRVFTKSAGEATKGFSLDKAAKSIDDVKKRGRKVKRYLLGGYRGENEIVKDLESIKKSMVPPYDLKNISEKLNDAIDKANQMLGIEKYISEIEKNIEETAGVEGIGKIKGKIEVYSDIIKVGVAETVKILDDLKKHLDKGKAIGKPQIALVDQVINKGKEIEGAIIALEALNKNL